MMAENAKTIIPKEYNCILTKGNFSSLATTPIEDGKLRFAEDTGALYLDRATDRIKISDIEDSYTEEEISEIIAPLPKLYLAKDTHRIYVFADGMWIDISEIGLLAAESVDKDLVIWMSDKDDNAKYDAGLSYNPGTKTLKVGNLNISTSTDSEGNKVVDFSF